MTGAPSGRSPFRTPGRLAAEQEPSDVPLVSFVVATYNRPDDLEEVIESVLAQRYDPIELVVVSDSTDRTSDLFEAGSRFDREGIRYYHYDERLGAPGAKNRALKRARGEFIVQLDDDAVLADPNATTRIVTRFRGREDVGIQAFQSRDYHTGEIKRDELPDPPTFDGAPTEEYHTTFFVGMGVAFRRDVLEEVGLYPEDFVYGFEEMDLSFRVLDAGYEILYTPSIEALHKKSPEGRIPDVEAKERLVENRINIALLNLPWRYVFFTAVIYSVYVVLLTRRLSSLPRVYRRLYAKRRAILNRREVVGRETIKRIKSRNSMLFLWWYGPHPRRILGRTGDLKRLLWEF